MSLYQKASLVQIPSGTKVNKLYSVVPNNGDGDFTGTMVDADSTRINKDGLVENVSTNVARLNYDPTNPQDPHLLLEPARTNSLPESENFGTNWFIIGLSVSSGISSPDGGTNAYSIIEGTATGGKIIYDTISVSAGSVTYSLFMKKGDKKYTALLLSGVVSTSMFNVDLENGTGTTVTGSFDSTNIEEYPNGWYRVSVTATATAGNLNCNVYLMNGSTYNDRNYTGNGTDKTYIFGAQLEAGSYATSYIPTSGSILTRTEDNIYAGGDVNLFNDTQGTLFVDIEPFAYSGVSRITLSDSSTSDRIVVGTANSTQLRLLVIVGGAAPFRMDTYRNITYNTRNKIAITYKENEYKLAINGTVVLTTTNSGLTPQGLNQLRFSDGDSGLKWRGKVFQTMVFNEALSNTELQELTSL